MNRTSVGIALLIMWLVLLFGLAHTHNDIHQLASCQDALKQEVVDACLERIANAVEDGVRLEALKEGP